MEGKIFSDSANIYQDQAKVLYEYYKSAAEKIVAQEKKIEAQIKEEEYQLQKYNEDIAKAQKMKTIGWCLVIILVGLIIVLVQNSKIKEFQSKAEEANKRIASLKEEHKNIFRDYKVTKMGVAYVPVAKRVAYDGKSFVVDQSGVAKDEKFTLQVIKQSQLINEAVTNLQDLVKTAPIVETSKEAEPVNTGDLSRSIQKVNFNDYFGKMDRTLRTISYSLGNVEEYSVELPVVFPDTSYARFLNEHATSNVEDAPVFNVFDTSKYDPYIESFNELNATRRALSSQSEQMDKALKSLMVDMADAVQSTAARKIASAGSLVDYSNRILYNILKAPYNFYSPVLEAEEIERIRNEKFDYESIDYSYKPFNLRESSRVKLDLRSMSWVAEDGSRTSVPFGVSQIQYEIIAPIVTNLLKDTRKDRIAIYNHIKDQKMSYLNKWHQDTEDFYGRNRAEAADIINLMRGTLAEYSAAYNTLSAYKKTEAEMCRVKSLEAAVTETVDNSAEVLAGYQAQSQQVMQTQKEFSEYMDRLHEDIDARAEKFGYVEYFDASLRDRTSKDVAVAASNVNALDDRRKPLAEVSPLLAQNSELPPVPNVEEVAYEYAGMNLGSIARGAVEALENASAVQVSHEEPAVQEPVVEEAVAQVEEPAVEEVMAAEEPAAEEYAEEIVETQEEEYEEEEYEDEEYDEDEEYMDEDDDEENQ